MTTDQTKTTNHTPSGQKTSLVFAVGWDSNLRARSRGGMKIPTVAFHGISYVTDNAGGAQLYYERLDAYYDKNQHYKLQLGEGEKINPSQLYGLGLSLTSGLIWKDDFRTTDYQGVATSYGGGALVLTFDYYENFPNKNLKGVDVGLSIGSPLSGWRISTFAEPITGRKEIYHNGIWDYIENTPY